LGFASLKIPDNSDWINRSKNLLMISLAGMISVYTISISLAAFMYANPVMIDSQVGHPPLAFVSWLL
jgi:hypothetical protein